LIVKHKGAAGALAAPLPFWRSEGGDLEIRFTTLIITTQDQLIA
jgi:hypothetical protein